MASILAGCLSGFQVTPDGTTLILTFVMNVTKAGRLYAELIAFPYCTFQAKGQKRNITYNSSRLATVQKSL
jgi:hypothetical protein